MTSHKPRKRFGQHFLHDTSVVQRMVQALSIQGEEQLIEIGPGQGALTSALIASKADVTAIELDRDLIPQLQQQFAEKNNFHLIQADALTVDYCALQKEGRKLRVLGNLPYNISTPILFHLLKQMHCIKDMCFMLQKEVVDRICAQAGGSDYGRLSVMVQIACRTERLFGVKPGAFRPPPKVDSAIVLLTPHPSPPVHIDDANIFQALVRKAFSQRRKTLRNNLRGWLDADTMSKLGIDPGRRAETLQLTEFATLSNAVKAIAEH